MRPPPPKRRRLHPPPASEAAIAFDPTARHDYLTGFHKRKQARIQHAKETAVRRAKDEKVRKRKEVSFPHHYPHSVAELTHPLHNRCGNKGGRIWICMCENIMPS